MKFFFAETRNKDETLQFFVESPEEICCMIGRQF